MAGGGVNYPLLLRHGKRNLKFVCIHWILFKSISPKSSMFCQRCRRHLLINLIEEQTSVDPFYPRFSNINDNCIIEAVEICLKYNCQCFGQNCVRTLLSAGAIHFVSLSLSNSEKSLGQVGDKWHQAPMYQKNTYVSLPYVLYQRVGSPKWQTTTTNSKIWEVTARRELNEW